MGLPKKNGVRPLGRIKIFDPRGYAYLPKVLRNEVGAQGTDDIKFFISANCVLLARKGASLDDLLLGLDVLKQDLKLRQADERDLHTLGKR
jgi:hypothetical protein